MSMNMDLFSSAFFILIFPGRSQDPHQEGHRADQVLRWDLPDFERQGERFSENFREKNIQVQIFFTDTESLLKKIVQFAAKDEEEQDKQVNS